MFVNIVVFYIYISQGTLV